MPDGDESYWMNEVGAPRERYEDFVTKDLIADVEGRFPARTDRGGRAVVGLSMGGFARRRLRACPSRSLCLCRCAQSRRRRAFPALQCPPHRPVAEVPQNLRAGGQARSARPAIHLNWFKLPARRRHLTSTSPPAKRKPLLGPIRRFVSRLKERGFAYEFHTKPGGHDWGEWNSQLPGCFASLESHLTNAAH